MFCSPNIRPFVINYVEPNNAISSATNCVAISSNGRTVHYLDQSANRNMKLTVYMIMYDVCVMQHVGQTMFDHE